MPADILVVEDDPASLQLMTYLLTNAGYSVRTGTNGRQCLEQIRQARPDLVVMDVQMPVMDGLTAAGTVRNDPSLAGIVMVAVTAVAMVGDREKVLAAGFDGYLTKPIAPETFVAELEEFIDAERRAAAASPAHAAVETSVDRRPGPSPDRSVPGAARILAVDDRPDNINLLRSVLGASGFDVAAAHDVATAVRLLHDEKFDLVICDFHLDGEHGFQVVDHMRSGGRRHPPVMLISSSLLDAGELEHARSLDVDDFVVRPIEPGDLLERVRAVLHGETC